VNAQAKWQKSIFLALLQCLYNGQFLPNRVKKKIKIESGRHRMNTCEGAS